MKKFLKIVLIVGALIGAAIASGYYATSGLTDTADAFFKAVKSQDAAKTRSHMAHATNKQLNDAALERLMADESLVAYQEASFPNRTISGDRGELQGTFTTTSGGVVPVTMVLVKEAGAWKVLAFQTAR